MKKIVLCLVGVALLSVIVFIDRWDSQDPKVSLVLEKKTVFIAVPPFELSGGTPPGGTYEGQGVANNRFSPEMAGAGIHEIVYTFCGKSVSDRIEVLGAHHKQADRSCAICKGTGLVDCVSHVRCKECVEGRVDMGVCVACNGTGRIRTVWRLWLGTRECPDCLGCGLRYEQCRRCKGSGLVKCPDCKGTCKAVCECVK